MVEGARRRRWTPQSELPHLRTSAEAGGVWIWALLLIVAAAAVGGGVFVLDQGRLDEGQAALSAAQAQRESGAIVEAEKGYVAALAALTEVSSWTPLNTEAQAAEAQALDGLRASRVQRLADEDPVAALRALDKLGEGAGPPGAAELRRALEQRLAREVFELMEPRAPDAQMDALWQRLSGDEGLPQARINALGLSAIIQAGNLRRTARGNVAAFEADLLAAWDESRELVDPAAWQRLGERLSQGLLNASARQAFDGFQTDLEAIQQRIALARTVHEGWQRVLESRATLKAWCRKIKEEPTFLGDLDGAATLTGFELPAALTLDVKRYAPLVAGHAKALEAQRVLVDNIKVYASEFKGMSVVRTRPGEVLFMDRHEVTRGDFVAFIDGKDGYLPVGKAYWSEAGYEMLIDKQWQQPEGWKVPTTDEEKALPLTGISFYEAEAFATFAGKRLPTLDEWHSAFGGQRFPWGSEPRPSGMIFSGELRPVTALEESASPAGIVGLLGNVAEVVMVPEGIAVAGGSVKSPMTRFESQDDFQAPAFKLERLAAVGLRLVKSLAWDDSAEQPKLGQLQKTLGSE